MKTGTRLAIAAAVDVYGVGLPQALATRTIGPFVEVQLLPSLTWMAW